MVSRLTDLGSLLLGGCPEAHSLLLGLGESGRSLLLPPNSLGACGGQALNGLCQVLIGRFPESVGGSFGRCLYVQRLLSRPGQIGGSLFALVVGGLSDSCGVGLGGGDEIGHLPMCLGQSGGSLLAVPVRRRSCGQQMDVGLFAVFMDGLADPGGVGFGGSPKLRGLLFRLGQSSGSPLTVVFGGLSDTGGVGIGGGDGVGRL